MSRRIRIPELPELPPDTPAALREWCEAVDQILSIFRGTVAQGTNTRFVTIQDLIDAGVIAEGDIE